MIKQLDDYCYGRIEKLFAKAVVVDTLDAEPALKLAGVTLLPDALPADLRKRFLVARRAADNATAATRDEAAAALKSVMSDIRLAVGPGLLLRAAPRHHVGG